MKRLYLFFLMFICFYCASISSQENPIFSNTGVISFQNDEYLIIGVLVDDLQKTLEIWSIPDSQGFPKISSTTKIKRDQPLSIFLVYSAKKNRINMLYDFKTLRPDGTFSPNDAQGLKIAAGYSSNVIKMSDTTITIIFDETDAIGVYQFHIKIYDNNIVLTNFIIEFNLIE